MLIPSSLRSAFALCLVIGGSLCYLHVSLSKSAAASWIRVDSTEADMIVVGDCEDVPGKCCIYAERYTCKSDATLQCYLHTTLVCLSGVSKEGSCGEASCNDGVGKISCNREMVMTSVDKCVTTGMKIQADCPVGQKKCQYDYYPPGTEGNPEVEFCGCDSGNICTAGQPPAMWRCLAPGS